MQHQIGWSPRGRSDGTVGVVRDDNDGALTMTAISAADFAATEAESSYTEGVVDDVAAAKTYLEGKGVATRMGPIPVSEGPAAGQSILYFQAPWGLQFEAISYPNGMAYEKDAETVLWSPKDPSK